MSASRKLRCRVQKITNHGDGVYTLDLASEQSLPRFKAGQFLHLALDDYDPTASWPDSRVFSIASSPAKRKNLRISYSVRGKYTTRMEEELKEGRSLWIKMPYGEFIVRDSTDVFLLAGGTGITAFTAFLEKLAPGHPHKVFLAYGARNRSLLTYRNLLEEQVAKVENLKVFCFIGQGYSREESGPAIQADPGPISPEFPGCIEIGRFWSSIDDPYRTVYYVSGPPAMNRSLSNELLWRGVRQADIMIDAWE